MPFKEKPVQMKLKKETKRSLDILARKYNKEKDKLLREMIDLYERQFGFLVGKSNSGLTPTIIKGKRTKLI